MRPYHDWFQLEISDLWVEFHLAKKEIEVVSWMWWFRIGAQSVCIGGYGDNEVDGDLKKLSLGNIEYCLDSVEDECYWFNALCVLQAMQGCN